MPRVPKSGLKVDLVLLKRDAAFLILAVMIVSLVSTFVLWAATNQITSPIHDEFAYLSNGLYYSGLHPSMNGMSFQGINYSYTWSERPPLIWWLLTSLFALGMNPDLAVAISPIFAVLLAVIVMQFSYEVTGDLKSGFFAGLLTALSGFIASIGARVLSDVMGTFFATLAVYCFYEFFFKGKRGYGILLGISMALGLIARDEDLIILLTLIIAWILFVLKISIFKKGVVLFLFLATFGIPVLHYGLAGTLQLISNLITPLILSGWPFEVIIGIGAAYVVHKAKHRTISEMIAGTVAFFAVMLPFFFSNYELGANYIIAGKGVLARPVAHLMMIPVTAGVGAHLTETARALIWTKTVPELIPVTIILAALIGLYYTARLSKREFFFILLWTITTTGYVVGATTLEDRFFLVAVPSFMVLAGIGFGYVWRVNKILGLAFVGASCFLSDITPTFSISFSHLTLVSGFLFGDHNWVLAYVSQLTFVSHPTPTIPLSYVAEGFLSVILGSFIAFVCLTNSSSFSLSFYSEKTIKKFDRLKIKIPRPDLTLNFSLPEKEVKQTENEEEISISEAKPLFEVPDDAKPTKQVESVPIVKRRITGSLVDEDEFLSLLSSDDHNLD